MSNPVSPTRRIIALLVLTASLVGGLACLRAGYEAMEANAAARAQVQSVAVGDVVPAQPPCVDSGHGLFNNCALLDTSRVDDLRTPADKGTDRLLVAEDGHLVTADAT